MNKPDDLMTEQLLRFGNELNPEEKRSLTDQIAHLDVETLKRQQAILKTPQQPQIHSIKPFHHYTQSGNIDDYNLGKELIASGKVGCLLIAGGQGTRLRFDGPKGMYPITPITKKTLFEFFCDKVKAAGNRAGRELPLAIMTSPLNDQQTRHFFSVNNYFGLSRKQVNFFSQKNLPMLDREGNLFIESPNRIAEGPDGNGYSLRYFVESGIHEEWYDSGVQLMNYVLIDNPLADPFDAELVGNHFRRRAEVTIKGTQRLHAQEKVGLVVSSDGQVRVIEYSEMPEQERQATLADGTLRHQFSNLSLYCFSLPFVEKAAIYELPLHPALKAAKYLSKEGKIVHSTEPNSWKFETFIFDVLPIAKKVNAVLYPREECFAPLKNFSGDNSVETVQLALQNQAKKILAKLKMPMFEGEFEIDPKLYYP